MNILHKIVRHKLQEIRQAKRIHPLKELRKQINSLPKPRNFARAIVKGSGIIAEIKRASPSKGSLLPDLNVVTLAKDYATNGAAAISVLTDTQFFQGTLYDLSQVKKAVKVPVLRKDFIIDEYQVYESRVMGADAILLIAWILSDRQLRRLFTLASRLGLASLIEVHDRYDLQKALKINPEIIGINNRNLKTFKTSLKTSFQLVEMIPDDCVVVSESGIQKGSDIKRLRQAGIDSWLIGETLVKARRPGSKLCQLIKQAKLAG